MHFDNQELVDMARRAVGAARLSCIATVCNVEGSTDLAIRFARDRLAVLRCVPSANEVDQFALAAMVAEGDFVWAGVIHGDHNGSGPESPIESFHLTEIDKLTARLRALGAHSHDTR